MAMITNGFEYSGAYLHSGSKGSHRQSSINRTLSALDQDKSARETSKPHYRSTAHAKKSLLGIGLVGSGFMGRCHAKMHFVQLVELFDLPLNPVAELLADIDQSQRIKVLLNMGFKGANRRLEKSRL